MSAAGQLWAEANCPVPANHPGRPLSSATWPSGYGAPGWESSQEWLIQPGLPEHRLPSPTKCDWLPARLPPSHGRTVCVCHTQRCLLSLKGGGKQWRRVPQAVPSRWITTVHFLQVQVFSVHCSELEETVQSNVSIWKTRAKNKLLYVR